ncbi:MAG: hypothetical protein ACR2QE_13130 [Acidimicrobiales bacterium]
MGQEGREVLLQQLIASMTGGLKGAHAEIRTDQGHKLTVVRSAKVPDMVIDTDRTTEVTEQFTGADGVVDVMGVWGMDATMARLEMETVSNEKLAHRGADDRDLDRLARLDQELLWELVNDVARRRADAETAESEFLEMLATQEADQADEHKADREDALNAIHVDVFEREQGRGRFRNIFVGAGVVVFAAALAFMLAVPSTISQIAVAVAALPLLWSLYTLGKGTLAKRALRSAEAETGMSLFESQVARVDSILSSGARRRAVRDSQSALEAAEAAWTEFTADADLGWVIRHKRLIQQAASLHRTGNLDPAAATESFGALVTRMVFEDAAESHQGEYLPLVFSEPFTEMSPAEIEVAIQLLAISAHTKQRIVLTDHPAAVAVARRGEKQQYLGVIEAAGLPAPA